MTYTLEVNGYDTNTPSFGSTARLRWQHATTDATTGDAYYLWVGGNLGTLPSQATNTYNGTANFTVEYN